MSTQETTQNKTTRLLCRFYEIKFSLSERLRADFMVCWGSCLENGKYRKGKHRELGKTVPTTPIQEPSQLILFTLRLSSSLKIPKKKGKIELHFLGLIYLRLRRKYATNTTTTITMTAIAAYTYSIGKADEAGSSPPPPPPPAAGEFTVNGFHSPYA
jgi:hypothetical protein